MSLGIVFKGPEGIVLAADSRVTLNAEKRLDKDGTKKMVLPSSFDNATKLLYVNGQNFIGAVTFGLGALGKKEFRTAHSFIPEFEDYIKDEGRLSVEVFSNKLGEFFLKQWKDLEMPDPNSYKLEQMHFLIGGYDEGTVYGRLFEVVIPSKPKTIELQADENNKFGLTYGGQSEFVTRLLNGFDQNVPEVIKQKLNFTDEQKSEIENFLKMNFTIPIPFQFLPLQDCVDLSIFLIRTTIQLQTWMVGVRGVGGAIDVATITRTKGIIPLQQKTVTGEIGAKPKELK